MNNTRMKANLAGLSLLWLASAGISAQAQNTPPNLLLNPGFEEWQSPQGLDPRSSPKLGSSGIPFHWGISQSTMETNPNLKVTGTITQDTLVKHDDKSSVCIAAGATTDIVDVSQIISVEPNTTYVVRCWLKGINIVPGTKNSGGVFVWSTPGPVKDYWSHMDAHFQHPPVSTGTFDWQHHEFTVDTKSDAGQMLVVFQIRNASGQLWCDNVEVIKKGTVRQIKSF